MRFIPAVRRIAEMVDERCDIGWVSSIHADFGLHGPFPASHRLRDPASWAAARCWISASTRST